MLWRAFEPAFSGPPWSKILVLLVDLLLACDRRSMTATFWQIGLSETLIFSFLITVYPLECNVCGNQRRYMACRPTSSLEPKLSRTASNRGHTPHTLAIGSARLLNDLAVRYDAICYVSPIGEWEPVRGRGKIMRLPDFIADRSFLTTSQHRFGGLRSVGMAPDVVVAQQRCPSGCYAANVACTGFLLWCACWCPADGAICLQGGWWLCGGCFGFWHLGCHR